MGTAKTDRRKTKSRSGAIEGTRLELTLAAEKVFALNGLRGGTLRQIREEAGQKNESVIHYHFGSREAIIESVLQLRSRPMDEQRHAMLREMREQNGGELLSMQQVVACCILPLAHYLLDDGEVEGYYIRFLSQMRMDRATWLRFRGLHGTGLNDCLKVIRELKPYLPSAIIDQRFASMIYMHLNSLAAIEQIRSQKLQGFRREEGWVRIQDLITTGVAIFEAPLSPATLTAIQRIGADPLYTDVSMCRQLDEDDWPPRR